MDNPIVLTTTKGRITLTMTCVTMGNDLVVTLGGGHRAHIGAISVGQIKNRAHFTAKISVITIPGHRETDLAAKIATSLTNKIQKTTCVVCGIHVDCILKNEIQDIFNLAQDLTNKLLMKLEQD